MIERSVSEQHGALRHGGMAPGAGALPTGLFTPGGWTALTIGAVVAVAGLGAAVAQNGTSVEPASAPPTTTGATHAAASLAGAQAVTVGGAVYRQADPLTIAAQNNPALAAQLARNSALAARPVQVVPTRIIPAQGAGVISQTRNASGAGLVVTRPTKGGPGFARGPAQGTAIAPRGERLPDSPK